MPKISKLKVVNLTVCGTVNNPNVYEKLVGHENVGDPDNQFPSRIKIMLEPRPVLLFKNGLYFIYGCHSIQEAQESRTAFKTFLKGVGLLD